MPGRIVIPARNKYRAKRTARGERVFASQAEASRYDLLVLMEKGGEITHLVCQPRFKLVVNGVLVAVYVGDFQYTLANGDKVVEDVKGVKTPVYKLKKKLMKALYGIDILETGRSR